MVSFSREMVAMALLPSCETVRRPCDMSINDLAAVALSCWADSWLALSSILDFWASNWACCAWNWAAIAS